MTFESQIYDPTNVLLCRTKHGRSMIIRVNSIQCNYSAPEANITNRYNIAVLFSKLISTHTCIRGVYI